MADRDDDLRALLDGVVAHFSGRAALSLDELAESLEDPRVGYADIEAVIDALEAAGVDVGAAADADLAGELARVMQAAHVLDRELGRRPTIDEIASRAALGRGVVHRALLYGRTISLGPR
jgi:hypothetical protein